MTTLDQMMADIEAQANRKGWSKESYYMFGRACVELGEMMKAIEEKVELESKFDSYVESDRELRDLLNELSKQVAKEAIDAYYFINQLVSKHSGYSLDLAFEEVFNDNEKHKKKTIDEDGRLTRK